jgi:hypothetical protein
MFNKRILFLLLFSFLITSFSPFLFSSYFEEKPETTTQSLKFGGPFPFLEQSVELPKESNKYPLEVNFASPLEQETKVHFLPFLFCFAFYFLFFLSLFSILLRFFTGTHKTKYE